MHHFWYGLSIVHFLVSLIVVRYPTDTFHMENVCWMTDDGQTDQKQMMDWPLKNDGSVKKDMFPAEHIFCKVPHHVPIYVDFYKLNQPTARCM